MVVKEYSAMDTKQATQILLDLGRPADLSKAACEQFLTVCKEGPTEAMLAYLALGMPVDSRVDISKETALIKAAEGGSTERLGLLLDHGASLELKDSSGDTALRTALNWSHPEAARFLHSRGADTTAVNPWGEDALDHAQHNGKDADFELLLELGADTNFVSFNHRSAFRSVLLAQRHDQLDMLLRHGANPNNKLEANGQTALHIAVSKQDMTMIEKLMAAGADPFIQTNAGVTARDAALEQEHFGALHNAVGLDKTPATDREKARAAVWHRANATQFAEALELVKSGDFSIDMRNAEHKTLLYLACAADNIDAAEMLLKAGAAANDTAVWAPNPLFIAVENNNIAIAKLLTAHGARGSTSEKLTLGLHGAVWNEREDIAKIVLDHADEVSEKEWCELLSSAVMKTNVRLVKMLHEHGAPINAHRDIGHDTILHQVCTHYPSEEMMDYLLKHGANLDARDSMGLTPLHALLGFYQYDELYTPMLRALLKAGARLDCVDQFSRTPYANSSDKSRPDVHQMIVQEPAEQGLSLTELAAKQSWATLPIWYAADRAGDVKNFIEAGVAFEPPADITTTPLLSAVVEKQDHEMLRFLLKHGANPNLAENYGTVALGSAAYKKDIAMAEMLIEHGARPDVVDQWNSTPFHSSVGSVEMMKLFIAHGVDPKKSAFSSAIFAAIQRGELDCVKFLLESGVTANAKDHYHGTPLHLAINQSRADIVNTLCAAGADCNVMHPTSGELALVAAAKKGNTEMVHALIAGGADPTLASRDGTTALSVFAQRKELRATFADILLKHGMDVTPPTPKRLADSVLHPSPYWKAVYSGDVQGLATMFANGQDPNEKNQWDESGLMLSVAARRHDMVQLYLEHKADVHAVNREKYPVFAYINFSGDPTMEEMLETAAGKKLISMDVLNGRAARSMFSEDVRKMLERGELKKLTAMLEEHKINPHDVQSGMSMLNLALQIRDEDLLEYLLGLGLSPANVDMQKRQPFALALQQGMFDLAERWLGFEDVSVHGKIDGKSLPLSLLSYGNREAVEWLIAHGASLDGTDDRGRTFLHACLDSYAADVALKCLDRCKPLINVADQDGMTVLHNILQNWWGNEQLAKALIDHGANINAVNVVGMTPLHEAVMSYCDQGAKLLIDHGASWDFVATGIDGAMSARQLAEERSIDPEQWVRDAAPIQDPDASGGSDEYSDSVVE